MSSYKFRTSLLLAMWALAGVAGGWAQTGPTIQLTVDATQAPMKIIHTHMVLPLASGEAGSSLTLYYPKWIPGEHAPDGPIVNLVGLKITADGKPVRWRRDLLNMFAFHVDVPEGVRALDIRFDYIEPEQTSGFSAGASATDKLVVVSWNQNVLYPAGYLAQNIMYDAKLILPEGWKFGTALPVESQSGDNITFKPVALNRLVDSPVIAGQYLSKVNVTPPGEPIHHEMDIAADSEAALDMSPQLRQDYTNLVAQTGLLFGARHYRDYHFLLTLSDHVAHFGLEHHESDDSRVDERSLIDPNRRLLMASLLPHEFTHSWNGKFRRPKDLSPPYYEKPMETDLLWVYEGLTNYFGDLLAERSGLWTPRQYREYLALDAASLGPARPGRTWRPLQDTADAAQILYFAPFEWTNWRRSVDYYGEGDLLWLDVDNHIRRLTDGKKSLTDFCHLFYGGPNLGPQLKPYTFDDVVNALNQVAPYDWRAFLQKRLRSLSAVPPMGGIVNGGWKLVYTSKMPQLLHAEEQVRHFINAEYSIGLVLSGNGMVMDSVVTLPAYKAGIAPGMTIVAVNGRKFNPHVFNEALRATTTSSEPLSLIVLNDDYYKTVSIDYHGGPRYPHLVRVPGKPDILGEDMKPLR
jgi:predicted metalloprotease with PDZ domain